MDKKITWAELLTLAKAHYNEGGDGIVECWTESDFNEYVAEFGPMTKAKALDMFTDRDEIIRDMEADADRYREEAQEENEEPEEEPEPIDYDWITDYGRPTDEWRPGDAPWNAPGMSVSDFIR